MEYNPLSICFTNIHELEGGGLSGYEYLGSIRTEEIYIISKTSSSNLGDSLFIHVITIEGKFLRVKFNFGTNQNVHIVSADIGKAPDVTVIVNLGLNRIFYYQASLNNDQIVLTQINRIPAGFTSGIINKPQSQTITQIRNEIVNINPQHINIFEIFMINADNGIVIFEYTNTHGVQLPPYYLITSVGKAIVLGWFKILSIPIIMLCEGDPFNILEKHLNVESPVLRFKYASYNTLTYIILHSKLILINSKDSKISYTLLPNWSDSNLEIKLPKKVISGNYFVELKNEKSSNKKFQRIEVSIKNPGNNHYQKTLSMLIISIIFISSLLLQIAVYYLWDDPNLKTQTWNVFSKLSSTSSNALFGILSIPLSSTISWSFNLFFRIL